MRTVLFGGEKISYFLERKTVKNINLRIKQSGEVCVSAPRFISVERIDKFVLQNASKILAARRRFVAAQASAPQFLSGDTVSVLGKKYILFVVESDEFSYSFCGDELHMTVKNGAEFENRKNAYDNVLRDAAERVFPKIINKCYPAFANYCKSVPTLKIRKMKAQWGNCRSKSNVITLNSRLAAYDKKAVEFVVLHEYCHFIQPNHSPAFYCELERVLPDWRVYDKVLKNR